MVFPLLFFPLDVVAEQSPRTHTGSSSSSTAQNGARFCFASCSRITDRHRGPGGQPWWDHIDWLRPDAFVWLGDAVYVDHFPAFTRSRDELPDFDKFYSEQKNHEGYQRMRKNVKRIFGTWDDHDYGRNDGDNRFIHKAHAQEKFLDFLDVPLSSPRRTRHGVYSSETIPMKDGTSLLFLLLDVRYHRDPWSTTAEDGDILGEEQWKWLEEEVRHSTAKAIIVGSGIQILWTDWGKLSEHWNNFSNAKARLLNVLSGKNVIFISGDVHMAEVRHIKPWGALEITSSGLTHSWGDRPANRLADLIQWEFPNTVLTTLMTIVQRIVPHYFREFNSLERNFACIYFDDTDAKVDIFSALGGNQLLSRKFSYDQFLLSHNSDSVFPNSRLGPLAEPEIALFAVLVGVCWLLLVIALLRCAFFKCKRDGDSKKLKAS